MTDDQVTTPVSEPRDGGDIELLGLIDRLAVLLERSDLNELEVESGGTALVLRKPVAVAAAAAPAPAGAPAAATDGTAVTGEPSAAGRDPAATARPSIKAPLTGIFYASPAPGTAPYVQVGGEVAVGQVIGLIEAMKLFNEIKSDLAGRVVRVVPESGALVKAKQPLIEVDPLLSTPVRHAHVTGWGRYAPSQVLTNHDLERMVDTSDEWIVSRTGIRERRVAAAHETTASMAAVASMRAIRTAGIDPDEIDLILLATLTPDYWMPSTAALVKEAIGNTRAAAMDVAAACSGFVYAYATAQAYIASGMARHVLVIGAELLTRFLDYTDRNTCILFGDGAGAVVLSASDEPGGGLGIEMTTEPQGAYMIWLPAGGAKSPPSAETVARGEHFVRMEGKETYRFATRTLATTALTAIQRAGLEPSDIDLFIPHQANIRIIEAVAKGLDLPMDRMFVNLDKYGNTSAASVPIALAEAVNGGRVKVGDRIVIVAFGAGFTSGAVAIEWTADPARGIAGDAAVRPEDVSVRLPVDWDSVDPIPEALAELMRRPGTVDVPLDDVVPGEPAATQQEVRA